MRTRSQALLVGLSVLVAVLVFALGSSSALASEQHPTLSELEGEIICPTCHVTLDQSNSLEARRIEHYISERIAAGDTKSEIKAKLVAQFGTAVLAAPPRRGFDLLVWWLPIGGVLAAGAIVGFAAWRWSRRANGPVVASTSVSALDPELEGRIDEELARYG